MPLLRLEALDRDAFAALPTASCEDVTMTDEEVTAHLAERQARAAARDPADRLALASKRLAWAIRTNSPKEPAIRDEVRALRDAAAKGAAR